MPLTGASRARIWTVVPLLVTLVFAADISTGPDISLSIFYLIPIALGTWFASRRAGLALSVVCALLWFVSDKYTNDPYANEIIPVWNMLVRLGFFVIVTVTLAQRRRIEAELERARLTALEATRIKSDFINRVTHELRTPLTSIFGFSELLEKRSAAFLTPSDQESLRRIRTNAETLLQLVDGVLVVARAEHDDRPPTIEEVDVVAVLNEVALDTIPRIDAERVQLSVTAGNSVEKIRTDGGLLRQVIMNLVANAVKFTAEGHIRLDVECDAAGRPLAIVIADTGIGIEPERLQAIFEPFTQADGSIHRRFGGAGLGLAIARDVCVRLGCTLEVESKPGVGSTFRVRLTEPSRTP